MNYLDFYNNLITEVFGDDQKRKWMSSDPNLKEKIIKVYIDFFNKIRTVRPKVAVDLKLDGDAPIGNDRFDISKYKTWDSFKKFVDGVRSQYKLNKDTDSEKIEIEGGKPLFEKNGLQVYYADSPKACITYKGKYNYSWCIAASGSSNMYYSYRLQKEDQPAFYFVKDIAATEKEFSDDNINKTKFNNPNHFIVIQVLKNTNINNKLLESYVVTDANNDGDRKMTWNQILKIQPKLKGLQSKFLPKLHTTKEKKWNKYYQKDMSLTVFSNLPYEEKEMFIDVNAGSIGENQFMVLPFQLKNKVIGWGNGLTNAQYNNIKDDKNLLKRYIEITERKFSSISKSPNNYLFGYYLNKNELWLISTFKLYIKYINDLIQNKSLRTFLKRIPKNNINDVIKNIIDSNIKLNNDIIGSLFGGISSDKNPESEIDALIDMLLAKGLKINQILTSNIVKLILSDHAVSNAYVNEILVNKYEELNENYSTLKEDFKTVNAGPVFASDSLIDLLLRKNIPLTKLNIQLLLKYSKNKNITMNKIKTKLNTIN